jgi:hypothetical protein
MTRAGARPAPGPEGAYPVPTLLISGTVGAGKSTVAAEICDVLGELELPNAGIDLDGLAWQWPASSPWNADLVFENLAALWPNFREHGAERLVLARVIEDRDELERYRAAVPGAELTVCRLVAPQALRQRRLTARMPPGPARDWHLRRTTELEAVLEQGAVEDFRVDNGERAARDTAIEVLSASGWLSDAAVARLRGPA